MNLTLNFEILSLSLNLNSIIFGIKDIISYQDWTSNKGNNLDDPLQGR